ncbi:IFT22 [Acanthosepion pharaonis]|uniref:IFT22 n=1 Tax=Acanthosepion pharaonis TaxID=158019 RepID=A0A812AWV7_ACAPH|nr:IFT22 [Sepia pharaonis]
MFKVKLLVLGPMGCGKTVLSNFLSRATEMSNISPTVGVRILEFEQSVDLEGRNTSVDVELWDCSGDHVYESCWPAFAQGVNGILFVFNPHRSNHDKELENLFSYFVGQSGLSPKCCLCLSNQLPESLNARLTSEPPPSFHNVHCIESNLETNPDAVRDEFKLFLSSVLVAISDKQNQEELSIMNRR